MDFYTTLMDESRVQHYKIKDAESKFQEMNALSEQSEESEWSFYDPRDSRFGKVSCRIVEVIYEYLDSF